jgi:parallel beta-helix repeat protein
LAYRGITVQDCQVFDINDNDDVPTVPAITHCSGINTTGGVADVFIHHNLIGWIGYKDDLTAMLGNGISLSDSCQASYNTIWAVKNGIQTYSGTREHLITNNFLDYCYTCGIYLYESDNSTVHNNSLRMMATYGIYCSNADKNSIHNNNFMLRTGNTLVDFDSTTAFIQEAGTSNNNDIQLNNFDFYAGTVTWIVANPVGDDTIIKNNKVANPHGVQGNPFLAANTSISWIGDTATPTASTDYEIMHSDCLISSTDSGNTDCAILIKNPVGTQINATAFSTLEAYFVPVGYKVNWGAFTGAAPTVKTLFL